MHVVAAVLAVMGILLSPAVALAANQTGHGTNGNSGNGVSGSTGNQGNGKGVGNAGGDHGGSGGGNGGGSTGGGTPAGGSSPATGSGSVGGPGANGVSGAQGAAVGNSGVGSHGGSYQGRDTQYGNSPDRLRVLTDLQACAAGGQKAAGLIGYDTKADGSFTYWSADLGSHYDFGQCLKGKGYSLRGATRDSLTNFGTR